MSKNKQLRVSGKMTFHNTGETVDCQLPVVVFEENENTIFYCPALDIAGYGVNEQEAKDSFEVTIAEYFSYTLNKKTLKADLARLGWQFRKYWKKKMTPPDISVSLDKNKYFKDIFDHTPFKKLNQNIRVPAFA